MKVNKKKRNIVTRLIIAVMLSAVLMPLFNNAYVANAAGDDTYAYVMEGRDAAGTYIQKFHEDKSYGFGDEWDIYSLVRSGVTLTDKDINDYLLDLEQLVVKWNSDTKPTDIEKVMIALSCLNKNVKDVAGVNLEEMLLSSDKLTEGSNELTFALLALKISGSEVDEATEKGLIEELKKFQNEDGGFALFSNGDSGIDTTAMALQALALYRNESYSNELKLEDVINEGLSYTKIHLNTESFDAGNSEAVSQVILSLTSLGVDPEKTKGFSKGDKSVITALMDYYIEGVGFAHSKSMMTANKMATVQAFQALESYRRYVEGEPSYWEIEKEDTKPAPEVKPVPVPDEPKETTPENSKTEEVKTENNKDTNAPSKTDSNTGKTSDTKKDVQDDEKEEPVVDSKYTFELCKSTDALEYTITAVREDEEKLKGLELKILEGSIDESTKSDIESLAENPYMFHFNTDQAFGAEVLVEMKVELEDDEYLLMSYNKDERKLELVQKVEVKEGQTKFIVSKGGDYCIARKAATEPLKEETDKTPIVIPVVVVIITGAVVAGVAEFKKKAKVNEK